MDNGSAESAIQKQQLLDTILNYSQQGEIYCENLMDYIGQEWRWKIYPEIKRIYNKFLSRYHHRSSKLQNTINRIYIPQKAEQH